MRHEVFENLIKSKRHYRHSQIFTESRLQTIANLILQAVGNNCSTESSSCIYPAGYDFNTNPTTWFKSFDDASSLVQINTVMETIDTATEEFAHAGTCICGGNDYPVAGVFKTTSSAGGVTDMRKHYCLNGAFTFAKETLTGSPTEVKCGEPHGASTELKLNIMHEFDDINPLHYYDWNIGLRFQVVPVAIPDKGMSEQVVGAFQMNFKYNPVSICKNAGTTELSTTPQCQPWTRTIESFWQFKVYNRYIMDRPWQATSWRDLRISMIPSHCNLSYRPLKIGPKMLKCELQKKLMTSITTMIWHEKLRYDLEELLHANTKTAGFVADPRATGNVLEHLIVDGSNVVYMPGNCFPVETGPAASKSYIVDDGTVVVSKRGDDYNGTKMNRVNCANVQVIKDESDPSFFGNLGNLNQSVADFMYNALNNKKNMMIPHCLKKHLTHNKMDFYCLTDTLERVDHEQFSVEADDQIMKQVISSFADKGPYRTVETSNGGFAIQNQNTHVNQADGHGHVYEIGQDNQFLNPDERVNAMTQDFTDTGDIVEPTG